MENTTNYYNLVRGKLIERWTTNVELEILNYSHLVGGKIPESWLKKKQNDILGTNSDDIRTGIELFTKIAIEAINNKEWPECEFEFDYIAKMAKHNLASETKQPTSSLDKFFGAASVFIPTWSKRKVSPETKQQDELVDKIKAFIEYKAIFFDRACRLKFPFSLLERSITEAVLKRSLKHFHSILPDFLMTVDPDWMSEDELDKRFGKAFQRLEMKGIGEACSNLWSTYIKNKDNKAGYYLLWLIKQAAGCSYKMPEKNSFNSFTVHEVLSQFFSEGGTVKSPANVVEILHYQGGNSQVLYTEILNQTSWNPFLNFMSKVFASMPMEEWPNKADIILNSLETLTPEGKQIILDGLVSSKDEETSKFGIHLIGAKAASLRKAIPHFYALAEVSSFNNRYAESVFNHPFIPFCKDKNIYSNAPSFTRQLQFNEMKKVFVHNSLIIGIYNPYGGMRFPRYLLAFDMRTEKMVWGTPLTTPKTDSGWQKKINYSLQSVGNLISLQILGESKVRFIDPETGEFTSVIKTPEVFNNVDDDYLHISPEGFAYQNVLKDGTYMFIGGKIIDGQWKSSFTVKKAPYGIFHPFSTHCGFLNPANNQLILFGPTGDQVTIENCKAAEAKGDKIYLIEKDPVSKAQHLTVRTLKLDKQIISKVEKSISLKAEEVSFGDLCKNGQWILFSGNWFEKSPIFVDLKNEKVTYCEHKMGSEQIINTNSGELWSWDKDKSGGIWKVSSNNTTLMGTLKGSCHPIHVGINDCFYLMDSR